MNNELPQPLYRPLTSYFEQGHDAWFDAVRDCPHPDDTVGGLLWRGGWLDAQTVDEELDDMVRDDLAAEARYCIAAAKRISHEIRLALPTIDEAASTIGIPAPEWASRCYEIATKIAASGLMQAVADEFGAIRVNYGVYAGPVAATSIFARNPFPRHGWLELDSGPVIDPTRWVFEATSPHVAVEDIDQYDLGAFRTKAAFSRTVPPFSREGAHEFKCSMSVAHALDRMLGREGHVVHSGFLGRAQALHVASEHPARFERHAVAVFDAFDANGLSALVPVDARHMLHSTPAVAPTSTIPKP
jgi:hypothetical protein